jgi:hypothetical protein
VYSVDTVEAAYATIQGLAVSRPGDQTDFGRDDRLQIFQNVWTIIDNVYAARQMAEALNYPTSPTLEEFQAITTNATLLRNKMDHQKTNAKNLANAKERPPLWAAVSYLQLDPETTFEDGTMQPKGSIVTVSLGRLRGPAKFKLSNPLDRRYFRNVIETYFEEHGRYVDGFELSAFGLNLSITDAFTALNKLIAEINTHAEKVAIPGLKKHADENGLSHDAVLSHSGGDFTVYAKFELSGTDPAT